MKKGTGWGWAGCVGELPAQGVSQPGDSQGPGFDYCQVLWGIALLPGTSRSRMCCRHGARAPIVNSGSGKLLHDQVIVDVRRKVCLWTSHYPARVSSEQALLALGDCYTLNLPPPHLPTSHLPATPPRLFLFSLSLDMCSWHAFSAELVCRGRAKRRFWCPMVQWSSTMS